MLMGHAQAFSSSRRGSQISLDLAESPGKQEVTLTPAW
jgi:hypothetical protein